MMKNKIVLKIILVLFVAMSCSDNKNKTEKPTNPITIKMVTHGQATDPFWSVVRNGAKDAAESLGINFNYQSPQTFDMITMSQIIDAVISTNPDGLIISVPDLNALKKSVRSASEKGIPIIVINSGVDIMKEVEILTYVGQSEYEAGIKAGEELLKYNITTALCVNHEIGNISLDQREQGFRKILNEKQY